MQFGYSSVTQMIILVLLKYFCGFLIFFPLTSSLACNYHTAILIVLEALLKYDGAVICL